MWFLDVRPDKAYTAAAAAETDNPDIYTDINQKWFEQYESSSMSIN